MPKRILAPLAVTLMLSATAYAQQTGTQQPTLPPGSGPSGAVIPPTAPGPDPQAVAPGTSPSGEPAAQPAAPDTAAAPAGEAAAALPAGTLSTRQIFGMQAQNAAGESLGSIDQLIVDPQSGEVTHAVVSVGGFLGIGEKRVAVPWEQLQVSESSVVMNMTREQLEQAQALQPETAASPAAR